MRWLEWRGKSRGKNRNLVIASAPIEVGDLLREHLFERVETVALCSATPGDEGVVRLPPEPDRLEGRRTSLNMM